MDVRLPAGLIRFLFGDFTQVYLLKPGQSVESVDVKEVIDRQQRAEAREAVFNKPVNMPLTGRLYEVLYQMTV